MKMKNTYLGQVFCLLAVICMSGCLWASVYSKYDNKNHLRYPHQKMFANLSTKTLDLRTSKIIGLKSSPSRHSRNDSENYEANRTERMSVAVIYAEGKHCGSPVESIAFIKTYKTGSTTVGHIMNRFGYKRNLSFVLNRRKSNGHLMTYPISVDSPRKQFLKPLNMTTGNYTQYKYDMITVHIRYNRRIMDTFMKPDTRYITVLRDPGYQFESAFMHFQFDDAFPQKENTTLKHLNVTAKFLEWFRKPTLYLKKLKQLKWSGIKGLRYYYAQNNQIFSLGLDVPLHSNKTVVENYISKLDKEFDAVLITEHLEESLLVMKKKFCLQLDDILFIPKNQRTEKAKNYTVPPFLRNKMRQWNLIDNQLYQHFNATLWKNVELYGQNFTKDLQEYRQKLKETFENCTKGTFFKRQGHYFQNVNYKPVQNASEHCQLLAEHKQSLMNKIRERQLQDSRKVK